jgi:predicted N-formylglutamate amidohydrolase
LTEVLDGKQFVEKGVDMNHAPGMGNDTVVEVLKASGRSPIVLVCEHASHFIPRDLEDLGMRGEALTSHAAWDPGARAVAVEMSERLDAPLVASRISRLVYDCNRPPAAPDAMPARSEVFDIPGNADLSPAERQSRVAAYYEPFRAELGRVLDGRENPAVVTIHSFTPVYKGRQRHVEIGVLHDSDTRLADAMLEKTALPHGFDIRRNAPYGPEDGVTHTLKEHALPRGRPNVMIEIRNDLIRTVEAQAAMAKLMSEWVGKALARTEAAACKA